MRETGERCRGEKKTEVIEEKGSMCQRQKERRERQKSRK